LTFNERDFPNDLLAPYGIESQHPDEFVNRTGFQGGLLA